MTKHVALLIEVFSIAGREVMITLYDMMRDCQLLKFTWSPGHVCTSPFVLLVAIIMGGHGRVGRLLKHEGVISANRLYLNNYVVGLIEGCCGVGGGRIMAHAFTLSVDIVVFTASMLQHTVKPL
jgi:hypothetical protein